MLLFLPFVLVGPVMVLAFVLLEIGSYGPLGWLADVALLGALAWTLRVLGRRTAAWWASTKAPVRPRRQDGTCAREQDAAGRPW